MSNMFTADEVKGIIMKWAEDKSKQGEIDFDETFCEGYIRYRTKELTNLIPDNSSGVGGWERPFHYTYEIECLQSILHLQLAFSYKNISDATKNICEEILEKYKMDPRKEHESARGFFRRSCKFDISIKDCLTENEILDQMDKLFYQMKGYETFILYKCKEEKEM